MKNIYLKPDEEIISVVDRLVQANDDKINLIIPSGAQIWQSSINLKLLKREANGLNKDVTLVVADDLEAEMAQRIGFAVRQEADFPVELVQAEADDTDAEPEEEPEEELIEVAPLPPVSPKKSAPPAEEPAPQPEPEPEPEPKPEKKESLSEDVSALKAPQDANDNMIDLLVQELKPQEEETVNPKQPEAPPTETKTKIYSPEDAEEPENKSRKDALLTALRIRRKGKMANVAQPGAAGKSGRWFNFRSKKNVSTATAVSGTEPAAEQAVSGGKICRLFCFSRAKLVTGSVLLVLAAAAVVCQLTLPTTEITIYPKAELVEFDISIVGRNKISDIDEDLNEIPLQKIEVSQLKSGEFPATGEKQISEKARGRITIFNEYSSSPQILVATTRFESPGGKVFRIYEGVTIPGAEIKENKIVPSSVEVEVIAEEPGEEYNIEAGNFTIPGFKGTPKYVGFYAESDTPMAGGSVKVIKVVSARDIEDAENELSRSLEKEVENSFAEQIPTDLKMIEESMHRETKIVSAVSEDTEADKFTMEVKTVASALLYEEEDLEQLVDFNISTVISSDRMILPGTQQMEVLEYAVDNQKGEVTFSVHVLEEMAWYLDSQLLKQDLAGLKADEVQNYLASQLSIQEAKVTFWPFWVKRVPKREDKIKINITSASLGK